MISASDEANWPPAGLPRRRAAIAPFHRHNALDQSRTNATCYDCHDAHNIGELGSIQRAEHRLTNPEVCGRFQAAQLEEYTGSDHGKAVTDNGGSEAAVCSDCHTTHEIALADTDRAKLAITKNCGDCHQRTQRIYFDSYHGQVHRLGYTNTTKSQDCHGGRSVKGEDDPPSEIHADNRLENYRNCHSEAKANFLSFRPHDDADDRENYSGFWTFKVFMELLFFAVMTFFCVRVLLSLYREVMGRIQGKGFIEDMSKPDMVYFRRFPLV